MIYSMKKVFFLHKWFLQIKIAIYIFKNLYKNDSITKMYKTMFYLETYLLWGTYNILACNR